MKTKSNYRLAQSWSLLIGVDLAVLKIFEKDHERTSRRLQARDAGKMADEFRRHHTSATHTSPNYI